MDKMTELLAVLAGESWFGKGNDNLKALVSSQFQDFIQEFSIE